MQREYAGTTRIVVAQRVSSVKNCDLILVLENGSVTGAGTHETLMQTCSEYRAIAETQMGRLFEEYSSADRCGCSSNG